MGLAFGLRACDLVDWGIKHFRGMCCAGFGTSLSSDTNRLQKAKAFCCLSISECILVWSLH